MKSRSRNRALCLLLVLLSLGTASAGHARDFDQWLHGLRQTAQDKGISGGTIDSAFADIRFLERVVALDRKQPEHKMTFRQYRRHVVNPARIKKGREMMRKHAHLLQDISKTYGVPPQYIVALWGIETNYGENTGGFSVLASLATLAYEGRRADFFRAELIDALKIIDGGHITPHRMRGSWAGAMGQNQFMPSSFLRFAVDHDQDGRKDIWGTDSDVFASTANYLGKSGWRGDERWGRAVKLPTGFPAARLGLDHRYSLNELDHMGIRTEEGAHLPKSDLKGSIVTPDGPSGPAYLVYGNYSVIMKWNRSTYFATSVGLLADAISG